MKCDHLLSSDQVLPSECVSGLVELIRNPNTSPVLISSIISLLAQLGKVFTQQMNYDKLNQDPLVLTELNLTCTLSRPASDDTSREILHSSYNLTSTLAFVIHCHSSTPGEPLVLQVRTAAEVKTKSFS